MLVNLLTFKNADEHTAKEIAAVLNERLRDGRKVLWLLSGGSAIKMAVDAAKLINPSSQQNLLVSLIDERYVPIGHPDSNWQQLKDAGFPFDKVTALPVLDDQELGQTAANFEKQLKELYQQAEYKIGLFGIGPDGHIASLFPGLSALKETEQLTVAVKNSPKPPPERITITPAAIKLLDEAVIYIVGSDKWPQVERLSEDIDLSEQPAQILKQVPKLTIYTDYKESEEIV